MERLFGTVERLFGTVERLFGYFLCSAHRWSVLKDFVKITLKRHSDTRWSSKAAAVNASSRQLEKVIAALEQLCDTLTEMLDTREDAALIFNGIEKIEFVALLFLWSVVLSSIDRIQKYLQAKETIFHQVLNQVETLIDQIDNWKNKLCVRAISDAEDLCNEWGVTVSRRIKKIRSMSGEIASDAGLSTQEEMHRSLRDILDKIGLEITDRFSQLREKEGRFGFLCKAESLGTQLDLQNHEQFTELPNKCTHLAQQYSNDLNVLELYQDYKDIISLKKAKQNGEKLDFSPKGLLKYISSMGLEAYKTLAIALQFLLTLPVSVTSCERSFRKMKLIKSYLRSTMSQDRFTNLAILSVENEVASSIDFSDVIKDFAAIKSREVQF
jgi:hypothetical protein